MREDMRKPLPGSFGHSGSQSLKTMLRPQYLAKRTKGSPPQRRMRTVPPAGRSQQPSPGTRQASIPRQQVKEMW